MGKISRKRNKFQVCCSYDDIVFKGFNVFHEKQKSILFDYPENILSFLGSQLRWSISSSSEDFLSNNSIIKHLDDYYGVIAGVYKV